MERGPSRPFAPTVIRRVVPGALQVMERPVDVPGSGRRMAVCIFWSRERAERVMYGQRCYPEDGWRAVELSQEQLGRAFSALAELAGGEPRLAHIEAAPGAPEVRGVVEPADLVELLRGRLHDDE